MRVVGTRVGALEELAHAWYPQYPVDADYGTIVDAEVKIEQIGRCKTGDVENKLGCTDVMAFQFGLVANNETVFKVSCSLVTHKYQVIYCS